MRKTALFMCAALLAMPEFAGAAFNYIDASGAQQGAFSESAESSPPPAPAPRPAKRQAKAVDVKAPKAEPVEVGIPASEPVASAPDSGGITPLSEMVPPASVSPMVSGGAMGLQAGQIIGGEPPAAPQPIVSEGVSASPLQGGASAPAAIDAGNSAGGTIIEPSAVPEPVISTEPAIAEAETDPKVGKDGVNTNTEIVARVILDDGYVIEVPKQTEAERRAAERWEGRKGDSAKPEKRVKAAERKPVRKADVKKAEAKQEKPAKPSKKRAEKKPAAPKLVDVPNPPEAFLPDEPADMPGLAPAVSPAVSPVSPVSPGPEIDEPAVALEEPAHGDAADGEPAMMLVPPATPARDFSIHKGSLRDQLAAYCESQGYRLEWNSPADLMVTNDISFSRGTFAGNVKELFETLKRIGAYGLKATLFNGNRTLVIEAASN